MSNEIPAEHLPLVIRSVVNRFENAPLHDALKEIETVLCRDAFAANFRNAETAGGQPWAPRVDPRKQHPLLILSGALFLSVTSTFGPEHISEIGARELTTGTAIPYAKYHQYGTTRMVARPFLDASAQVLDECREIAADAMFAQITQGLAEGAVA